MLVVTYAYKCSLIVFDFFRSCFLAENVILGVLMGPGAPNYHIVAVLDKSIKDTIQLIGVIKKSATAKYHNIGAFYLMPQNGPIIVQNASILRKVVCEIIVWAANPIAKVRWHITFFEMMNEVNLPSALNFGFPSTVLY